MAGHVREIHVLHAHVAAKRHVVHGARVLVWVLPGPEPRVPLALHQLAVLDGHVHERHVARVLLDRLVEQFEDALGAGKTHDHEVDLHRHLADLRGELLGHVEERHGHGDGERQAREAQVWRVRRDERAGRDGHDHVEQVAEVHEDGHEGVGVAVGLAGGVLPLLVDLGEVGRGLVLVAEDLDDALAGHELLDRALELGHGALLAHEVLGRAPAEEACGGGHEQCACDDHERHRRAVVEHDDRDRDHDEAREQELRQRLRDHHAHGVDVVGVVAHDVAVLVRVEVADRQVLHVVEHGAAELLERALRDVGHGLRPEHAHGDANQVEHHEHGDVFENAGGDGVPVAGRPGVLDDGEHALHEDVGDGLHDAVRDDAHDHRGQKHRVEAQEHLEHAQGGPAHVALGRHLALALALARHP